MLPSDYTGKHLFLSSTPFMQIEKILEIIESYAPRELALEWDKCGIQVAGSRRDIKKMAVALDPDEKTIKQAVNLNADFILTHHPLSLKPKLPDQQDSFNQILTTLLTSGTTLYSAHTSLDANPDGPARWLSSELKLEQVNLLYPTVLKKYSQISFQSPLDVSITRLSSRKYIQHHETTVAGLLKNVILPSDKVDDFLQEIKKDVWPFFYMATEKSEFHQVSGLGFTGSLAQPMSFELFLKRLKDILGVAHISMAGEPPDMIQTIGCCPGSGGDFASKAFSMGADIYITGDLKYHQAQDLALKGAILDVGHFILEEKMMFEWYNELKKSLKEIELIFIEGQSPFKIL